MLIGAEAALRPAPGRGRSPCARGRGEGWHARGGGDRRLAARGAPLAPDDPDRPRRERRRARLGPQHPRLRPAGGAAATAPSTWAGSAATVPRPGWRSRPGRVDGVPRGVRRPRGGGAAAGPTWSAPRPSTRLSAAIASGCAVAEELERLRPFGMGNPGVRLLVPAARLATCARWGTDRHSRFSARERRPRARSGSPSGSHGELAASPSRAPVDRLGEARAEPVERRGRAAGRS